MAAARSASLLKNVPGYVITTDGKWKDALHYDDLPARLFKRPHGQFDWMTERQRDEATFVVRRGRYSNLSDFVRTPPDSALARAGWTGYEADGFSSGALIRVSRDGDQYMIASYRVVSR